MWMSFYDEADWGGQFSYAEDLESPLILSVSFTPTQTYAMRITSTRRAVGIIDVLIDPRFRNNPCDMGAFCAHIREGHGVFVTDALRHFLAASKLPKASLR